MSTYDAPAGSLIEQLGGDCLRIVGATPEDQVFTKEAEGTFNVTKLARDIARGKLASELWRMPIDERMLEHMRLRDINVPYAEALGESKCEVPGIILVSPPAPPEVEVSADIIDGTHRLYKRNALGCKTMDFYAVKIEHAAPYRVRYEIHRAGKWEPLADEIVLNATWGSYGQP